MSTQTSGDIADSTITHCSLKVEKLPTESVRNCKLFFEDESYSASSSSAPWCANERAVNRAEFAENRRLANSSADPSLG